MNKKILLVEDDPNFGNVLKDYLIMNEFDVTHAINGEEGIIKYKLNKYDLCILDIMMPKQDGFCVAKEIKKIKQYQPIIFLTARNMKEDILTGYKIGAEDYITKPFDSEVLLYKIRAIIHRHDIISQKYKEEKFNIGSKFYFNSKIRELYYNNNLEHKLSPKENELLKLLCIYKNDLMPREIALNKIWHDDNYFTSRSMDVYIAKLRKYLKKDCNVEIINIHGEGFRLIIKNT